MNRAPIKERIVALRYKRVTDEVYREVCDALGAFLLRAFPDDGFVVERLNRPEVTLPCPTIGDEEPDWGVSVSIENATRESLRNAVVRQYVMLADKSRRHALTDEERGIWKRLLADSDYGDFCQRTAPAVKDVATRIRAVRDGVEVVWSSGENETIPNDLARPLVIVEDGEEFSARVKFIDYRLASLSEVVPLGKPAPVGLDDLFETV